MLKYNPKHQINQFDKKNQNGLINGQQEFPPPPFIVYAVDQVARCLNQETWFRGLVTTQLMMDYVLLRYLNRCINCNHFLAL